MENMKNNQILLFIIAGLFMGGLGFLGGTKYQQSGIPNNGIYRQLPGGGMGGRIGNTPGQGRFAYPNRPLTGEILSMDDSSITIKLPDGSSKIVILSDKTVYNKSSEGSKNDLQSGERVFVTATDNSDGSVTALTIQLNPAFGTVMMGGGRFPQPTGNLSD